jgi:peptide/nickel transport system substrate-binding protein
MCVPEVFGEFLWQCFLVYDEKGMPQNATFQKIDDYHFMIIFPQSKPEFMTQLLAEGGICFAPEHYYVNLLPEYMGEDAAAAKAKAMGYSDVKSMLNGTVMKAWNIPGLPTLNPYCISDEEGKKDVKGDYYEFVRNPYYWKVDGNGQQLPYIDRLGFTRISGESQKMMLTTEGFLSVSMLNSEQVAEAESGKTRGGYRIVRWSNFSSFAVKNNLQNFPETAPYEEKVRGIGAAHVEGWYMQ